MAIIMEGKEVYKEMLKVILAALATIIELLGKEE